MENSSMRMASGGAQYVTEDVTIEEKPISYCTVLKQK